MYTRCGVIRTYVHAYIYLTYLGYYYFLICGLTRKRGNKTATRCITSHGTDWLCVTSQGRIQVYNLDGLVDMYTICRLGR